MKVVINGCYGGFGLSNFAYKELLRRKGKECYFYENKYGVGCYRIDDDPDNNKYFLVTVSTKDYGKFTEKIDSEHCVYYRGDNIRNDLDLIAMIEEFGSEKCSGRYAELEIEDVPSGTYYRIGEYDGIEYIEYRDDIDWLVAE